MGRVTVGERAPDFTLAADDGSTVRLADLAGGRVVLYFYPKDATSGCTTQACAYRDAQPRFQAQGVRVLGVSPDPLSSHEKFRDDQSLNFTLLSDPEHTAAEAYGVWVEKSMYGRTYMGIERSTFVIGPDGVIEDARYKVKAGEDTDAVLALLAPGE